MSGSGFLIPSPDNPTRSPFLPAIPQDPLVGNYGNVANAAIVFNLSGGIGKTAYIGGFCLSAFGATAASIVSVTVSGLTPFSGDAVEFFLSVPAGATTPCTPFPLMVHFPYPLQAAAPNSSITVTVPALGAGNTKTMLSVYGFRL